MPAYDHVHVAEWPSGDTVACTAARVVETKTISGAPTVTRTFTLEKLRYPTMTTTSFSIKTQISYQPITYTAIITYWETQTVTKTVTVLFTSNEACR